MSLDIVIRVHTFMTSPWKEGGGGGGYKEFKTFLDDGGERGGVSEIPTSLISFFWVI